MTPDELDRLAALHRVEASSLLQYYPQADAYVGPADRDLHASLIALAADDKAFLTSCADRLRQWGLSRVAGPSFPQRFASWNFLTVAFYPPRVLADLDLRANALHNALAECDDADGKFFVSLLLEQSARVRRELVDFTEEKKY